MKKKYDVRTVNGIVKITEEDIKDIMWAALDGGINYWAYYDENEEVYLHSTLPFPKLCTKILLSGGWLLLIDFIDGGADYHYLTLDKLLTGIQRWIDCGYDMYGAVDGEELDCGNIDSDCADCIIQLALFNDIVYG